jgi:hypothetical protein
MTPTEGHDNGARVNPGARAAFAAAYGRLVTAVWSGPDAELLLRADPPAALARYGLALPEQVTIEVTRTAAGTGPDLDALALAWADAADSGVFVLPVPALADAGKDGELSDAELNAVVGGLGPTVPWRFGA